jgi:hypothetical protein
MNQTISEHVKRLRSYHEVQLLLGKTMVEAYGGTVYHLDLLAIAVLNRSLALISGFCLLIEAQNFICAAPLVRLQVDNCLRFSAAGLVDNPHSFARQVLDGVPVNKLRDRNNKRMTDRYLAERLTEKYPWVLKLYQEASGYIHLSDKHIFHTVREAKEDKAVSFRVGAPDADLPDEIYVEAIRAFTAATDVLIDYVRDWIYAKSNPEELKRIKNLLEKGGGKTL